MEIIILKNFLIVLNYNDAETTLEFVEMAKTCNAIDKIVVVDNCSTDYSLSKLTCLKSDKIDVIQTDKNGGYAYGNNFGCRYAEKIIIPSCSLYQTQMFGLKIMYCKKWISYLITTKI